MKLTILTLFKKKFFLKFVKTNKDRRLFLYPNKINNILLKDINRINISTVDISSFFQKKKKFFWNFFNKFILCFLENFFKKKVLVNLKKGSNNVLVKQISSNFFFNKFFKKNLKVKKQIIGVLYYSILLKDTTIFNNFFKKNFEKVNLKLHKKLLLGLRKIIKEVFYPIFNIIGIMGIFLNINGKLGVSGNAKKRRYFFYFGQHSLTKRTLKVTHTHTKIWTSTGSLGFTFYLFF